MGRHPLHPEEASIMPVMSVGLCNTHTMVTNEDEEITLFVFYNEDIHLPMANDVHEHHCRKYIQKFKDNLDGIRHKKRAADRGNRNEFHLYVTGHSPLLTSFLKCWVEQQDRLEMCYADLVLWHWDRDALQYIPQKWAVIT